MNLNDIERLETSDEEKEIELASQTKDAYKSNGINDMQGRFFDRNRSRSSIRDFKVLNTEREKSGTFCII